MGLWVFTFAHTILKFLSAILCRGFLNGHLIFLQIGESEIFNENISGISYLSFHYGGYSWSSIIYLSWSNILIFKGASRT